MIDKLSLPAFSAGQAQMLDSLANLRTQASNSAAAPALSQSSAPSSLTPAAPPMTPALPPIASRSTPAFSSVLEQAINHVDRLQHQAADKQRAVDMGTSDDLTGAMLESQKAGIAFSAMMQVRNKLSAAFDDVMNISI